MTSSTPPLPECCWCAEPATDLLEYDRGPSGPRPVAACPCCPTGHTSTALGRPRWRKPIDSPGTAGLLAGSMNAQEKQYLELRVQGSNAVARSARLRITFRNAGLITRDRELTTLAYRVAVVLNIQIPREEESA